MCRYLKDLGATLASTVVHAMFEDAKASCHVLSTDATGAAIQPEPAADGRRQACNRGHFFTIVADCDHVLYHYTESHSSNAVQSLFQGFSGLLQSDASSVYDVLERGPSDPADDKLTLVGCWSHCRRYFFDAAITKHRVAVEGLRRIREIFRIDAAYAKLPPGERKVRRAATLTPLFDAFFAWVDAARISEPGRSLATKALGYAHNQEHELRRVLLDGRLPLDNNRSERALRTIVVGRKNWLFYGSDTHAVSAAAIFTIIASCRLHRLDPLAYLTDLLRVLPFWPADRLYARRLIDALTRPLRNGHRLGVSRTSWRADYRSSVSRTPPRQCPSLPLPLRSTTTMPLVIAPRPHHHGAPRGGAVMRGAAGGLLVNRSARGTRPRG
jgi:hypothetical protein